MNSNSGDILTYYEAERFIESLKIFDIKDFGNSDFLKQHVIISKLNIQAHLNVINKGSYFISCRCGISLMLLMMRQIVRMLGS